MTREQAAQALAVVKTLWPHSTLGQPEDVLASWATALADFDVAEVGEALQRLRDGGREHAPPVGVVVQALRAARQGPPPTVDEIQATLARLVHLVPYDPERRYTPEDTALAVNALAAYGVHEAALRFVVERGLRAVLVMPDPSRYSLDPNQSADRRDMARAYRDETLPGWRMDPTPGRALERACRVAGLPMAELPVIEPAPRRRRALPAPAGQEPLEEGPFIGPGEVLAAYEAASAERERLREAERAQLAAARRADAERRRAALSELSRGGGT